MRPRIYRLRTGISHTHTIFKKKNNNKNKNFFGLQMLLTLSEGRARGDTRGERRLREELFRQTAHSMNIKQGPWRRMCIITFEISKWN